MGGPFSPITLVVFADTPSLGSAFQSETTRFENALRLVDFVYFFFFPPRRSDAKNSKLEIFLVSRPLMIRKFRVKSLRHRLWTFFRRSLIRLRIMLKLLRTSAFYSLLFSVRFFTQSAPACGCTEISTDLLRVKLIAESILLIIALLLLLLLHYFSPPPLPPAYITSIPVDYR